MRKLFETVMVGKFKGVIVAIHPKRVRTYYDVIFEDAEQIMDEWGANGLEYETFEDDELNPI